MNNKKCPFLYFLTKQYQFVYWSAQTILPNIDDWLKHVQLMHPTGFHRNFTVYHHLLNPARFPFISLTSQHFSPFYCHLLLHHRLQVFSFFTTHYLGNTIAKGEFHTILCSFQWCSLHLNFWIYVRASFSNMKEYILV